jgi:lycopene cyclase domain-containing protein
MLNYLLIDAIILLVPLLFSFERRICYYTKYPALFTSVGIVGSGYIVWDALVTWRGDWWFDEEYLVGLTIVGLPIEEILFFVVVPYSCLYIYEALRYFLPDKEVPFSKNLYVILAGVFAITGVAFFYQDYTILAMMSCALFFTVAAVWHPHVLTSRLYWLYIIVSFVPFMIFNYLLTSTVIVHYNPDAIWGVRITTIPLEDFFYNFSMLSLYFLVYVWAKSALPRRFPALGKRYLADYEG